MELESQRPSRLNSDRSPYYFGSLDTIDGWDPCVLTQMRTLARFGSFCGPAALPDGRRSDPTRPGGRFGSDRLFGEGPRGPTPSPRGPSATQHIRQVIAAEVLRVTLRPDPDGDSLLSWRSAHVAHKDPLLGQFWLLSLGCWVSIRQRGHTGSALLAENEQASAWSSYLPIERLRRRRTTNHA